MKADYQIMAVERRSWRLAEQIKGVLKSKAICHCSGIATQVLANRSALATDLDDLFA